MGFGIEQGGIQAAALGVAGHQYKTGLASVETIASITVTELLVAYRAEADVAYRKNGNPTSHLHNVKDGLPLGAMALMA